MKIIKQGIPNYDYVKPLLGSQHICKGCRSVIEITEKDRISVNPVIDLAECRCAVCEEMITLKEADPAKQASFARLLGFKSYDLRSL